MTMLTLKSYQQAALDALTGFLRHAAQIGAPAAFRAATQRGYADEVFGGLPCVCLRIPTGGGKTLLASHAIPRLGADWLGRDFPTALWLVPSDAIRSQTLKALQTPQHAYRAALEEQYGANLVVCSLEELSQIAPSDWGVKAVVIVATIQSFRVEETAGRTVYSFSEDFERHFKGLPVNAAQALRDVPDALVTKEEAAKDATGILKNHLNQPRQSLANWLALQAPILIVDEAHNTKTDKSFTALKRLNPSAILELTATPITSGTLGKTNVLYHVSAQELAAEHMIKLPISLAEHAQGWPQAVFAAVQQQKALEAAAIKDEASGAEYVRPIVLFQAQNENDEMPPEKLRTYLQDELHVPPEQIVVATGNTRELDGLDILSRSCPVRFVITVQALREGWDCPFAYILCSLQKLSSATAVEQLLGRVLRMPYATRRGQPALNRAYAHVCEAEFSKAAHALADRLINGMGFEALDVASMLVQQSLEGDLFESNRPPAGMEYALIATNFVVSKPSEELLALPGVSQVSIGGEVQIAVTGAISADLEALLVQGVRGEKKQTAVREQIEQHNALVAAQKAPASRGAVFAPVPLLGYRVDAQSQLWPLEREAVLEAVELDLLTPFALELPNFDGVNEPSAFEIGMKDSRINIRAADASQLVMDGVHTSITAQDLVRWLDQSLFQKLPDLTQSQRLAWFTAVVNRLLHEKHHSLVQLAQSRFKLAQHLEAKAADVRALSAKQQFKQLVLQEEWQIEPDWQRPHVFEAGRYPAPVLNRYCGRWQFEKHYYPVLADLKDGGEEFLCAQLIDANPNVRHWVRNLDTKPCGFWLPTSTQNFYPDFIVERNDGLIVVIEYKGAYGADNSLEIEKRQVGELWGKNAAGRARFGWIMKSQAGVSMAQQLEKLLA
ncbi:MAG: DEAD/DEAH box helicase family protein [Brachymonas sp.]|nr:DEAD/DEAH box helicase family protein [Brachymonas sp.]